MYQSDIKLNNARIAEDVYKYLSLEEQKDLLEIFSCRYEFNKNSTKGIIIVTNFNDDCDGGSWQEVKVLDQEVIKL